MARFIIVVESDMAGLAETVTHHATCLAEELDADGYATSTVAVHGDAVAAWTLGQYADPDGEEG